MKYNIFGKAISDTHHYLKQSSFYVLNMSGGDLQRSKLTWQTFISNRNYLIGHGKQTSLSLMELCKHEETCLKPNTFS